MRPLSDKLAPRVALSDRTEGSDWSLRGASATIDSRRSR